MMKKGAALGAVAATATVLVPICLPTLGVAAVAATTFSVASIGGMLVDLVTQVISHEVSESCDDAFALDAGRLLKVGITTGTAGVVPTYGNPGESVINAIGSQIIGFNASFFNAAIEVIVTQLFK